jgi:3-hydroxyacyl-CoA dehydrogenase
MAYTWSAPDVSTRPVAVIGGGVLGRRLCMMWACTGYEVRLFERSDEVAKAALAYIDENIDAQVKAINGKRGVVTASSTLEEAVGNAWMVIEAIPERLEIKIPLFEELDKVTKPDCILASNSSSYKSSEMIVKVKNTYRVCNGHYYMPPVQNCVEFMTCGHTDPGVIALLMKEAKSVGFIPVHARVECTGFIFNRIWAAMKREVLQVLAEGVATPEDIDTMFVATFGANTGLCQLMDKVGLDTVYNIEKHYVEERHISSVPLDYLKANYVDKGKLGNKSGGGLLTRK